MKIRKIMEVTAVYDSHDRMFTICQCAEYLKLSERTIRRKIERGIIKATYLGTTVRIPKIQFLKILFDEKPTE